MGMEVIKYFCHKTSPSLVTVKGFDFRWDLPLWSELCYIGVTIIIDDCVVKVESKEDFFLLSWV